MLKNVFVTTVLIAPFCFCGAQTAPGSASATPPAASPPAASASFNPAAPSDILNRSLDEVKQTVSAVHVDKWKRGSIRDEAGNNVDAIQRDMKGTLPSLLKDADGAPTALSKVLPLSRNVDALYDVLVHLVEQARVSGTGEEAGQLQQALSNLEKARVTLDTQILQTATLQEKQIVDLRTTVQKQEVSLRAAATPPPAPKCPAPTPPKKKRTTKPSTTAKPGTSSSGAATTPPKPQ
jgi:BRCT domain type II-containing protein